jgi:1-acyl-sn-glycerol-3-phosphate acyltransferase
MNSERMAIPTSNRVKSVLQTAAFWGAFLIFAAVGSLVSVACAVPAFLFRGVRARFFGQRLIRALFVLFVGYLRAFGLLQLDAGELSALRQANGLIVVANHPGLLDAVLLVSLVPQAVCLMKGSLARNIVLSGTARLAGYIHNNSGLGLIKQCEERLKAGSNLLVFPEGTRTVGGKLLPFKMGFALAAVLTRSPVQTIIINSGGNCLGKGWPFFKKPVFPVRYALRLGRRFPPEPGQEAKQFGRAVEAYFRETLARSGNGSS